MKISALMTSAGINIGICVLLWSLYSVLRKQPAFVRVYFGRRIAEENRLLREAFILERFVPSTGWIVKALQCTEEDLLAAAGLDAIAFNRILVFSIRIFSLAAILCLFGILPVHYFGRKTHHLEIPSEQLHMFTVQNVEVQSRWLWVHSLVLYIISGVACFLLHIEYKHIARLRLLHLKRTTLNPGQFTVLVRGIPKTANESCSSDVDDFFTKYHASSYLFHQVVYKAGKVQKIMTGAKKACGKLDHSTSTDTTLDQSRKAITYPCCVCGASSNSFQLLPTDEVAKNIDNEECAAAFVFFKTRYGALLASQALQTSNPTKWVTDLAPEPDNVYWSNIWLPYKQLWIRRIATLLGSLVFSVLFLLPVTFIQGLSQLDQVHRKLPFLNGLLKQPYISQIITGYLPSVILLLFLYTVSPIMILFSTLEGPTSHSERKRSACSKVLYFFIWNVFFVNLASGAVISQLNSSSTTKDIAVQLAGVIPGQTTFFITYVLTSGWASLSSELMQLFGLIYNFIIKYVLRMKEDTAFVPTFPYHTEVPKVMLFGLLGFSCSVLAPLILPFLLVYFFLGYVVYRNQLLNVYRMRYDSGGLYWPIAHNTVMFSLVLTQIICFGVFGLKKSPVAAGFTIPPIFFILSFNQYCRTRFLPLFKTFPTQDLIDLDREDERSGRMEHIHHGLRSAYRQFPDEDIKLEKILTVRNDEDQDEGRSSSEPNGEQTCKEQEPGRDLCHPTLEGLPVSRLRDSVRSIAFLWTAKKRSGDSALMN
ncbi:CSC1-like protein RXW8 isoform X1 [Triticum dicoccoides]|uniref:CSC1-like protein RXW8 isoform X1 n=1 Tax=Triticum dicoccoides TaxID=85692 RepID=UPI000E7CCB22|nr:CSC1-like protein RXW8 isoform X1 [Triticum dicoccoides]XP_037439018.1 CSC1-like protein RXW8 isoform X1 [Triticum dicoccoides]XP_037439019.1 CSC1-like protein RXW8 isoform X1 [Triticum dicoccoides]